MNLGKRLRMYYPARSPMNYEELDEITRRIMLEEFEAEEAGAIPPYRGTNMTPTGRAAFPGLMREAIIHGNGETLAASLKNPEYWFSKGGVVRQRNIDYNDEAARLGLTEFNTWYVRGLAKRLMDEGERECQIYRAAYPKTGLSNCPLQEGAIVALELVYKGHRAKYWPSRNPTAFSIPAGPNCHHTIRRIPKKSVSNDLAA